MLYACQEGLRVLWGFAHFGGFCVFYWVCRGNAVFWGQLLQPVGLSAGTRGWQGSRGSRTHDGNLMEKGTLGLVAHYQVTP